jgi:surface antigen
MKKLTLACISAFLFSDIGYAVENCCGLYSPGNNFKCGPHENDPNKYGNCTWYARYKRPEVDGICTLDASQWFSQAKSGGLCVGSTAVVGSIAVFNYWMTIDGVYKNAGHVAYVESVNADGSFNVSEMGWNSWDCVHYGTWTKTSLDGLIGFIYPVGRYSDGLDGFHTDGTSQAFINAFNRHYPKIGWPTDYVHKWTGPYDTSYRVWIQDFQGDMNAEHFGTDGQSAVILNSFLKPTKAYLVKEGMWGYYKINNGPAAFGEPFTEEVTLFYATNALPGRTTDPIKGGDSITVQKFNLVKDGYNGLPLYENQRRTLVYNNTRGGSVFPFAVGTFSLGNDFCPTGEQAYVYVDGPLANDIPWPNDTQKVPTGDWYTKSGDYTFVRHVNGQKCGALTVHISEGNHQFVGGTVPTAYYTYSSHAYTGAGDLQGTDWNHWLPTQKTQFTIGETVKAMIRVENISIRHKWSVEIWRGSEKLYEYAWNWNEVNQWVWPTSHFWPEWTFNREGSCQFRVYLYIGDDSRRDHIIDLPFTVVKPANWQPYTYSSHAYTGTGEVQGGKDADWNYSLPTQKTQFTIGETARAMIRVENISVRHRWFVEIWQGNTKLHEYAWNWGEVEQWTWKTSYFWPERTVNSEGSYQFRVYLYVGDDSRKDHIIDLPFTVVKPANWQAYTYDGNGYIGYGPPIGGADTGWNYSLPSRATVFNQGDHVYGMVHFNNVYVNHRFHLAAFRNNALAYNYTWAWNNVNGGRWDISCFWPELGDAQPGNWEFDIYLEYDGKVDLVDTLFFTVNGASSPPPPPPVKPSVRYDFNAHNPMGWTVGYDTSYIPQDQKDFDTWMVAAKGPNPGVVSPELPNGFSASLTPQLRFSVKVCGPVRQTYGQVWLLDYNGNWGYETRFAPVSVDYQYYEYTIDLSRLGNIPIRRFSFELTQDSPYEQWIFDWVELK